MTAWLNIWPRGINPVLLTVALALLRLRPLCAMCANDVLPGQICSLDTCDYILE
jgi:hypothetical protein